MSASKFFDAVKEVLIDMIKAGNSKRSSVQGKELTNEGRHRLLLLHKQVHDKRRCRIIAYLHKTGQTPIPCKQSD